MATVFGGRDKSSGVQEVHTDPHNVAPLCHTWS